MTNHSSLKATRGKVQCITSQTTPACPWRHVINISRFAGVQISIFFSSALVELAIFIVPACCQCNCRQICLVRPEPLSHSTRKQKKSTTQHITSYRCTHHLQMLTKDYWQGTQWAGMDWIKRDLQKAYSDRYLLKHFLFSRISYFVFPFSEVFIHFYQLWSRTSLMWQQSRSHTQVWCTMARLSLWSHMCYTVQRARNRYGLFIFTARQRNNYVFWLNRVSALRGATPLQKQRKRLIMKWWDADDQLGGGGGLWFKDLDKLRLNHFIWLVFEAMNLN